MAVRTATAKLLLTPFMPILPKIATSEAKKALNTAYIAQVINYILAPRNFSVICLS
jgi:hypothetical protein